MSDQLFANFQHALWLVFWFTWVTGVLSGVAVRFLWERVLFYAAPKPERVKRPRKPRAAKTLIPDQVSDLFAAEEKAPGAAV